jgi:hypothetical protein
MDTKARVTKQGVRDLNRYGPKLGKDGPPRPAEPGVADEPGAAEKKSDGDADRQDRRT